MNATPFRSSLPLFTALGVSLLGLRLAHSAEKPAVAAKPAETAQSANAAQPAAAKPADLKSVAAALDGYLYKFPCAGEMPENPKKGADADSALVHGDPKTTDNFSAVKQFGGTPGKRYEVTLRFRGVVEPMMYKNGQPGDELFYVGGEPNNATYNIYKLSVSSPASHYFLNRQDKVGHRIFTIDYTKTIEIDGGATVTFSGDGQNGRLISNFEKLVVPGVSPEIKQPYHGQFVQVNVVDVKEKK